MKKLLTLAIGFTLILTLALTTTVGATDSGVYGDLAFTSSENVTDTEYYTWDYASEGSTLTIKQDMTINGTLTLPATTALTINDGVTLTINGGSSSGISAGSGFSINAIGDLVINSDSSTGIETTGGTLTIAGDGDVTINVAGTHATGINISGAADASADIDVSTIYLNNDLTITGTGVGIIANDGLEIIDNDGNDTMSTLTITTTGNCVGTSSAKLNFTTITAKLTAGDGAYAIETSGQFGINMNAEVTANTVSAGSVLVSANDDYPDTTLNAWVKTTVDTTTTYTLYGTMDTLPSGDTIAFEEGSKLTIAAGEEVDWSKCTVTWDNANIVNNGTMTVPTADGILSHFTGSGTIFLMSYDGGDKCDGYYYTDGTSVGFVDLSFDNTADVTDPNGYYTWNKDNKTLTINVSAQ